MLPFSRHAIQLKSAAKRMVRFRTGVPYAWPTAGRAEPRILLVPGGLF